MALTVEQVKEGERVNFKLGDTLYYGKIIGQWSKGKFTEKKYILVEFDRDIPGGHGNGGNGYYLNSEITIPDNNSKNRLYITLYQNIYLDDLADSPPLTSTPEQQFITGMKFKLKDNPEHMKGRGGEMCKIIEYKDYTKSAGCWMVNTEFGYTYESDFEAFESPVSIVPKNNAEGWAVDKGKDYAYIIEGRDPIINAYTTKPITPSEAYSIDDTIKVSVDITPFLNQRIPLLNTNN